MHFPAEYAVGTERHTPVGVQDLRIPGALAVGIGRAAEDFPIGQAGHNTRADAADIARWDPAVGTACSGG